MVADIDLHKPITFHKKHGEKTDKQLYIVENERIHKKYKKLRETYMNGIPKNSMLESLGVIPYHFDVLKMDYRGCELNLLAKYMLNKANGFVINVHKPQRDDYQVMMC